MDDELRQRFSGNRRPTAEGFGEATAVLDFNLNHEEVAKEFAEDYPDAAYIVVITVNDTDEIGEGTLFEVRDGGSIELVEEVEGYEGAQGNDVKGHFEEQYGVDSYASREA